MHMRNIIPTLLHKHESSELSKDYFDDFRREFDHMFERFWNGHGKLEEENDNLNLLSPRVDVSEDDKKVLITAEVPSLNKDDIELTFDEGMLTFRGEKETEREEKDEKRKYYVSERSYGSFFRTIPVGTDIDEENIEASCENGVLTIELPKTEKHVEAKKKIPIK